MNFFFTKNPNLKKNTFKFFIFFIFFLWGGGGGGGVVVGEGARVSDFFTENPNQK